MHYINAVNKIIIKKKKKYQRVQTKDRSLCLTVLNPYPNQKNKNN